MIFYTIVGIMLLGDVLWAEHVWRSAPRRWMRWTGLAWIAAQFAMLCMLLTTRRIFPEAEEWLPRFGHSLVLAWHLLIIPPWLVWHLARCASQLVRKKSPPAPGCAISRRQFLGTAAMFTPPILTLGAAWAGERQLDDFRIRSLDVPIANLPPALDGAVIAHVTDTHVGRFTRGAVLERIVTATNKLDADLIAFTGDLINHSLRDMPPALELIRALKAKHGVIACEGNHDLIEDARTFYREAERGGLHLLRGATHTITLRGQRVQILGLPWARGDAAHREATRELLKKRDPAAWPLLLAHHPHAWDFADGIPLTLAGHTHGGQLMVTPEFGCGPAMFRYWSGLHTRAGHALVVSNGTGNWFPLRIGAPAEILRLTLRRITSAA